MHKVLSISPLAFCLSLLALASCSTELTAPPEPPPPGSSDLSAYFWADSTATYRYQVSTGDLHTIMIYSGGSILDKDQISGASTTLTITRASGMYALSGFSASDFLGLDPWLHVVKDTAIPAPRIEAIRTIAAMNPKFGFGTLFAASDSVLYRIDLHTNALVRLNTLPSSGLTLAEDVNQIGVYAFQKGGNNIYWTSDNGLNWRSYSTPAGPGITAFASANPEDGHYAGDLFWVACGAQIYRFSMGSNSGTPISYSIGNITALEAEQNGVIAAGDDGAIYDISRSGSATPRGIAPSTVRGMASHYVSTATGVFDIDHSGIAIDSNDISTIYATNYSVFGARSDGTVDHFAIFGPPNPVNLPAPSNSSAKVTQFAFPYQGSFDPSKGIYVVTGTQVFYRQDASTWTQVNQTLSAPAPLSPVLSRFCGPIQTGLQDLSRARTMDCSADMAMRRRVTVPMRNCSSMALRITMSSLSITRRRGMVPWTQRTCRNIISTSRRAWAPSASSGQRMD